MNIKINSIVFELTEDIGELKAFKNYSVDDLVKYIDTLLGRNEELEAEVKKLKEEIENLEEDIKENYKPISKAEQYDMGECNFH